MSRMLIKAKRVYVPASGKRKAYFRIDTRTKKVKVKKKTKLSQLQEHINLMVTMYKGVGSTDNIYSKLKEHGRNFNVTKDTYKGKRGTVHQCYRNAGTLASSNKNLTYVEGFTSVCGIPLAHAWVIDKNNNVIDPTIKGSLDNKVEEYFGIPFTQEYLNLTILKTGIWGLIGHHNKDLVDDLSKENVIHKNKDLIKSKKMPIGTVSKGRKKVKEGLWVPIKKERKTKMKINYAWTELWKERGKPEEAKADINKIKNIVAKFPEKIRNVLKETKWAPFGDKTTNDSGLWISAWYDQKKTELNFPRGWLYSGNKKDKWILTHEISHVYHIENPDILKKFSSIADQMSYKGEIHSEKKHLLGEYFADGLAEYINNPEDLKKNTKDVYNFFDKFMNRNLIKSKRMPIGTISKGRKKIKEGLWVPVKKEKKIKEKPEDKTKSFIEVKGLNKGIDFKANEKFLNDEIDKIPLGESVPEKTVQLESIKNALKENRLERKLLIEKLAESQDLNEINDINRKRKSIDKYIDDQEKKIVELERNTVDIKEYESFAQNLTPVHSLNVDKFLRVLKSGGLKSLEELGESGKQNGYALIESEIRPRFGNEIANKLLDRVKNK